MSKTNLLLNWRMIAAAVALGGSASASAWTGTGVINEIHDGEIVIADGSLAAPADLRVNLASGVGSIGTQQLKPGMPVRFEVDETNPRLLKEIWILKALPGASGKYGDER